VLATVSMACWAGPVVVPDPLADSRPVPATCAELGPPPLERVVVTTKPGEDGCPVDAGFARCLTAEAAVDLAANIEALRGYADDAWRRCGVDPPDAGR
jgi:hypothetical protein